MTEEDGSRGDREEAVVTVDGPAGSGKSTTAREVARRLGYRHLDSGSLYRALTFALLEAGTPPERWPELTAGDLDALDVTVRAEGPRVQVRHRGRVLDEELRTTAVTAGVSRLSSYPAVRQWLLGAQRGAGVEGGLVADGRDMGSVVFPDADLKVFLTADLTERARRRLAERPEAADRPGELEREAQRIRERDEADSARDVSPLVRPPDAVVLDTTRMGFEEQVEAVVSLVERWRSSRGS